jgi:predicted DsbA family dithiol-disulfide isomerase
MPTKEECRVFSALIEELVQNNRDITYIDAIVEHCKNTGFEVEMAATLLTASLKAKITEEAESLNLIKKTNRLPI